MNEVRSYLAERKVELDIHLALLEALDERSKEPPVSPEADRVEVRQILILKSSILVHLYNVIEATFARTLDQLSAKATEHHPKLYSPGILDAWISSNVQVNNELNIDRLRKNISKIGATLVEDGEWPSFEIKKATGNWSEDNITSLAAKLGINITLDAAFRERLYRPYFNDDTQLKFIRKRRNDLAHGFLTFEEGAASTTLEDLKELSATTTQFMEIVVEAVGTFIESGEYLKAVA